jgi:hypothetical protein
MPPKDNITLGPGTLYFNGPEGLQPLGEVQEVELTEEAETFADTQEPIVKATDPGEITFTVEDLNGAFKALSDTATAIIKAWNKLWEALTPMLDRAAKDPRTPRLAHLAKHGKNRRIRKKNAKRLFNIMKGE